MKYFKLTQILKTKGSDQIVDECLGYVMAESLEGCQELEDMIRDIDPIYKTYDIQNIYEECSKEEYDYYHDRRISLSDLNNEIIH